MILKWSAIPIIEWGNLYIQNGTLYGEMTEESEEYIKNITKKESTFSH